MRELTPGEQVQFSELGRERVQSMPEAWGLHRALYQEESGEVVDFFPPEEDAPAQVSVEFPSGGAYNWDADCFELLPPKSNPEAKSQPA